MPERKKIFTAVSGEVIERRIESCLRLDELADGDKVALLSRTLAQNVLILLKVNKSEGFREKYRDNTLYEFLEANIHGRLTRAGFGSAPSSPNIRPYELSANFGTLFRSHGRFTPYSNSRFAIPQIRTGQTWVLESATSGQFFWLRNIRAIFVDRIVSGIPQSI